MRIKEGHEAMIHWDRTWKPGHLPMWAKKKIRLNAIQRGEWSPGSESRGHLPDRIFDHWGTVKRGAIRVLIAQPYGIHDWEAKDYAMNMGWDLKISSPGPWHKNTTLYEFSPRNAAIEQARKELR